MHLQPIGGQDSRHHKHLIVHPHIALSLAIFVADDCWCEEVHSRRRPQPVAVSALEEDGVVVLSREDFLMLHCAPGSEPADVLLYASGLVLACPLIAYRFS